MANGWRRFRPERPAEPVDWTHTQRDELDADLFVVVQRQVQETRVNKRAWRRFRDMSELNVSIDTAKHRAEQLSLEHDPHAAAAWLYTLVLQAPRAAEAQEQMDKHPHGYHNKEQRLLELIDFNDAFVATVLTLPAVCLPHFEDRVKQLLDTMCQKVGTRCFSNEEYQAIVHGLSREIAVYRGAQTEGYEVEMTNRATDAFGIDMRITDPKTFRSVNVDIKTRSSFHYRMNTLAHEGRLSEEEYLMADRNGFAKVYNGRGHERTPVVVWRIDHELLGSIECFSFVDTAPLGTMLRDIMFRASERV